MPKNLEVFAKNLLVKVFLSKIDKCLIELALPKLIMDYGGQTKLAETFVLVM